MGGREGEATRTECVVFWSWGWCRVLMPPLLQPQPQLERHCGRGTLKPVSKAARRIGEVSGLLGIMMAAVC